MVKELAKNTEQKIMEVATELFAKNGFEGASIREICKKASVNISLISYYFGGKEELYKKIIERITENILEYMSSTLGFNGEMPDFSLMNKKQKIDLFFMIINKIIDYFYSDNFSDAAILILFREQITSGIPINAPGYTIFRRLLASIIDRDENDKEVVLRCITILGQIHSARIMKQFSLNVMKQRNYTKDDIQLLKNIISAQIKSIFIGLGVFDE